MAATSDSEDARQCKAARVVKSAIAAAVLLEPAQHDVPPVPVFEAIGRIQHVPQIQWERPCTGGLQFRFSPMIGTNDMMSE